MSKTAIQTIDPDEVANFEKIADTWWDPTGPFKPLHMLNPTRLGLILDEIAAHRRDRGEGIAGRSDAVTGLRILDIGCGGGLTAEPLARKGAKVVGVDASEKNIKTASVHAARTGVDVDYRCTTAEALADAGEQFDAIINMEVIEHVADVDGFMASCAALLKPGAPMLLSTINRNPKSFLFAIVGAEYVLRWLPRGTHQWGKFITPAELTRFSEEAGLHCHAAKGFRFNPLNQSWAVSTRDTSVNYAMRVWKPSD